MTRLSRRGEGMKHLTVALAFFVFTIDFAQSAEPFSGQSLRIQLIRNSPSVKLDAGAKLRLEADGRTFVLAPGSYEITIQEAVSRT